MGNKLRKIGPPLAVFCLFLIGWQAAVMLLGIERYVLPTPIAVAVNTIKEAPRLMEVTLSTLGVTLIGFAAGTAAGFLLAALLHIIPGARAGFYPLLVLTQNVPVMAIGSLLVVWFGFGIMPRVVLIVLVCFFPVVVAMLTGLTQSDPKLAEYMRMIGASKSQMFWRLELPGAISYLFSGLKIAASYSVISAIYAESIGGSGGLGNFMLVSQHGWQTENVFSAIVIVVLLSLVLFGLISLAERLFMRGRVKGRRG